MIYGYEDIITENEAGYVYQCSKCCTNPLEFRQSTEHPIIEKSMVFKNGCKHIKLLCGNCSHFLKFKPQCWREFVFPFGKLKGQKLADIDYVYKHRDYLNWWVDKSDFKDNLKRPVEELLEFIIEELE